jgi:hypothetical protein
MVREPSPTVLVSKFYDLRPVVVCHQFEDQLVTKCSSLIVICQNVLKLVLV